MSGNPRTWGNTFSNFITTCKGAVCFRTRRNKRNNINPANEVVRRNTNERGYTTVKYGDGRTESIRPNGTIMSWTKPGSHAPRTPRGGRRSRRMRRTRRTRRMRR